MVAHLSLANLLYLFKRSDFVFRQQEFGFKVLDTSGDLIVGPQSITELPASAKDFAYPGFVKSFRVNKKTGMLNIRLDSDNSISTEADIDSITLDSLSNLLSPKYDFWLQGVTEKQATKKYLYKKDSCLGSGICWSDDDEYLLSNTERNRFVFDLSIIRYLENYVLYVRILPEVLRRKEAL